jgi:hypothetical protein
VVPDIPIRERAPLHTLRDIEEEARVASGEDLNASIDDEHAGTKSGERERDEGPSSQA